MDNKKVTKLNTYSFDNTLENIRSYKRKKTVRRRATLIAIMGLFILVIASVPILKNIQSADKYDAESIELTEELETAESERKILEYEVALLEDDEYIAKLARKELNLSKPNEILINLPEDDEKSESEEESEEVDEKED